MSKQIALNLMKNELVFMANKLAYCWVHMLLNFQYYCLYYNMQINIVNYVQYNDYDKLISSLFKVLLSDKNIV